MLKIDLDGRQAVWDVRDGPLFEKKIAARFQWFTLLAYVRKTETSVGGWVSLEQTMKLPLWTAMSIPHAGGNVRRYLEDLAGPQVLVETDRPWRGPYRLTLDPAEIVFEVNTKSGPLGQTAALHCVARFLGLSEDGKTPDRQALLQFRKTLPGGHETANSRRAPKR